MAEVTSTVGTGSLIPAGEPVPLVALDVQTGNPNTFDGERVEAFKIESLNEQERKQAQEIGEITNALLLKALLHRFDSALYPLPSNSSSPEAIIFQEVVKNISPTD